ncbi:hypothetical protein VCHA53O466_40476 [Vibrio chagasii]|nr:hypothetical protein VCHA53O466_40476 [Vibrio chagasii]
MIYLKTFRIVILDAAPRRQREAANLIVGGFEPHTLRQINLNIGIYDDTITIAIAYGIGRTA